MLCKRVRESPHTFGNMQVILVGDFLQLPPVANELYGDPGNMCFRLPWFDSYFPHKINLKLVHRQEEHILINCINELETGDPSDESVAFLTSLNRPIQNENSSIQLFARNIDVDIFNYNKVKELPGELRVYKATDEGSEHYLNRLLAPKNLGLKVGCPVMLVKNINDSLVNGIRGTVLKLYDKSVDVNFDIGGISTTANITPDLFSTYDPVEKNIIAKRIQLPLKLAYALTIHKSQGMTLENVTVNCEHCIQPGQLGVAVGRAKNVSGLKVVNFKKHLCKKHPQYVFDFYGSFMIGEIRKDMKCCRSSSQDDPAVKCSDTDTCSDDDLEQFSQDLQNFDDSDFSDSEIEMLEYLHEIIDEDSKQVFTNEPLPARVALDNVIEEFKDSPVDNEIKRFKDSILNNFKPFNDWYEQQSSVIDDIGLNCFPEGTKFTQKHRNDFFVKFNLYINAEDFENSVKFVMKQYGEDLQSPAYRVLTSILFYLERNFFTCLSSHLSLTSPEPLRKPSVDKELDAAGKGKIRYISGYVIAKLKYNLSKKIRNSLFVKSKESELLNYQKQMDLLNSLCSSYAELTETCTDLSTLQEIKRKQNQREGLTNISDTTFGFFERLEIECREKLTHANLVAKGKSLYNDILNTILNQSNLFEAWTTCLTKSATSHISKSENGDESNVSDLLTVMVTSVENYVLLFNYVVTLFLKVSLSQFRRDYLAHLKIEKGKALRKKVTEKSIKSNLKRFDINFYSEDKSKNKEASVCRMKSELLQNPNFFVEHSFTKVNLISICKDFNLKVTASKKKNEIAAILAEYIMGTCTSETSNILTLVETQNPSVTASEQPGPSGISVHVASPPLRQPATKKKTKSYRKTTSRKGKGKGKKSTTYTEESDEGKCDICYKAFGEGEDCICCDDCQVWFHRECVGLVDDTEWARLQEEDQSFTCPMCL